jgi:hypothetical protein
MLFLPPRNEVSHFCHDFSLSSTHQDRGYQSVASQRGQESLEAVKGIPIVRSRYEATNGEEIAVFLQPYLFVDGVD